MSSETKRVRINLKDAELALNNARNAFDREDYNEALKFAREVTTRRIESLGKFESARRDLEQSVTLVERTELKGDVDLREAFVSLVRANQAFQRGDYETVRKEAQKAKGLCYPTPKLGKHLIINMELSPHEDENFVRFVVKVGNKSRRTINEVPLKFLGFPSYLAYTDQKSSRGIREEIRHGETKTYETKLELFREDEQSYYLGRDIQISTMFSERNDTLSSSITITNRSADTLVDIVVRPFVPEGFYPDREDEEIDILYTNESKVVEFYLIEEGEESDLPPLEQKSDGRSWERSSLDEIPLGKTLEEKRSPRESLTRAGASSLPLSLDEKQVEFADDTLDSELDGIDQWQPPWKAALNKELEEESEKDEGSKDQGQEPGEDQKEEENQGGKDRKKDESGPGPGDAPQKSRKEDGPGLGDEDYNEANPEKEPENDDWDEDDWDDPENGDNKDSGRIIELNE